MITEPASTPDHREIRDLVRDVASGFFTSDKVRAASVTAEGYDDVVWKHLVSLGWTGLTLPAEAGGEELGTFVACLVHRELGARLAPSPYLATAGLAATALTSLGDAERTADLLSGLAAGDTTAALVPGQGHGWPSPGRPALVTATETAEGWVLDGQVPLVLDGARADLFVVLARAGADVWALFHVDGSAVGLDRSGVPTVDPTRSFADVTLSGVPARLVSRGTFGPDEVAGLVDRTVVLLAAEMVGAAQACLELTLDYLRTRRQFGTAIGSFQALKHRCADAAVAVTVAQESVFAAAEMVDAEDWAGLRVQAPLLLAQTAASFRHAAEEGIQLHGGVGFTDEFDIGLYYKRALVDGELVASVADAHARLDQVRYGVSR